MLTINDLSTNRDLDKAAMTQVCGGAGFFPVSWFDITNAPTIDAGVHQLLQGQSLGVNQAGNLGGLNLVISNQSQNGIAGQVA